MTIPRPNTNLSSFTLDDDLTDVRHQCDLILSILCDVLEHDGADHLGEWFDHVGFDPSALRYNSDLMPAYLGHYRNGRAYDVDRALNDFLSWPPVSDRMMLLSKKKKDKGPRPGRRSEAAKNLTYDLGNLANDL